MLCKHCSSPLDTDAPFDRSVAGGRAWGQVCRSCGHIGAIRQREETDPPIVPDVLTEKQINNLGFVRWRLADEIDKDKFIPLEVMTYED